MKCSCIVRLKLVDLAFVVPIKLLLTISGNRLIKNLLGSFCVKIHKRTPAAWAMLTTW